MNARAHAAGEEAPHAAARIVRRPMWRVRLGRELPRYLLCGASAAGLAASARFAIVPPRAPARAGASVPAPPDRGAEGYAVLFARRYLTWTAAEPQASARALEGFFGPSSESGGGLVLPATGQQHVQWAEVVQAREAAPNEHVYTVAAQTDSAGLLYLSVGVVRSSSGALQLAGYPAFVGAPAASQAVPQQHGREVNEPALRTVVERALRNYLAGSAEDLAADLTSEARVSLPTLSLSLQSLQRLDWMEPGTALVATVLAQDERGAQYVLAYELRVALLHGRWEVSAVQTDPDS